MSSKVKIGSVVVCVLVILICCIGYTGYVSRTIYRIRTNYPEVEGCSARMVDAAPEGYFVYYYEEEELTDMEVVEVTWQLTNITNEWIYADYFWASYYGADGRYLSAMRKEDEDLLIPSYENEVIIPAGEQVNYTEYVLVPEGMRSMEAEPGYTAGQSGDATQTFMITF